MLPSHLGHITANATYVTLCGRPHNVTIQTQVRDPSAVASACARLGLSPPVAGVAKLFNVEAAGLIVQLPGWNYPIVCQTEAGSIAYDNFEGRWGDPAKLNQFLQ